MAYGWCILESRCLLTLGVTVTMSPMLANASLANRALRLRSILTEDLASRVLLGELLPAYVANTGQKTVLDFSDWSQFSQWPQSQ